MNSNGAVSLNRLRNVAPPFSANDYKRHPFRLPAQQLLSKLKNVQPIWVPVFNVPANTPPPLNEQAYTMAIDFWWLATMCNVFCTVQLFRNVQDDQGNVQTFPFQFSPVIARILAGTLLHGAVNVPFQNSVVYLPEPVFFPAGSQIQCSVSLDPALANSAVQVILFGATEGA